MATSRRIQDEPKPIPNMLQNIGQTLLGSGLQAAPPPIPDPSMQLLEQQLYGLDNPAPLDNWGLLAKIGQGISTMDPGQFQQQQQQKIGQEFAMKQQQRQNVIQQIQQIQERKRQAQMDQITQNQENRAAQMFPVQLAGANQNLAKGQEKPLREVTDPTGAVSLQPETPGMQITPPKATPQPEPVGPPEFQAFMQHPEEWKQYLDMKQKMEGPEKLTDFEREFLFFQKDPEGYAKFKGRDQQTDSPPIASPYATERAARTLQSVDELTAKIKTDGRWVVGGLSEILARLPESEARAFRASLNTLKSNVAFNELTAMREASKTGGALGQVSNIELGLLQDALGALDAAQSPEQFTEQLNKIKASVQRWQQAQTMAQALAPGSNITISPQSPQPEGTAQRGRFNPATGQVEY